MITAIRTPTLLALVTLAGCGTLDRLTDLEQYLRSEQHSVATAKLASQLEAIATSLEPRLAEAVAAAKPVSTEPMATPEATVQPPLPARAARPRPAPPRAVEPETWVRDTVRDNRWLTANWSELTDTQQAMATRSLRQSTRRLAAPHSEPAAAWDTMGLSDRARLVFKDTSGSSDYAGTSLPH